MLRAIYCSIIFVEIDCEIEVSHRKLNCRTSPVFLNKPFSKQSVRNKPEYRSEFYKPLALP